MQVHGKVKVLHSSQPALPPHISKDSKTKAVHTYIHTLMHYVYTYMYTYVRKHGQHGHGVHARTQTWYRNYSPTNDTQWNLLITTDIDVCTDLLLTLT